MASPDEIAALRSTIERQFRCTAKHRETVPVHEVFRGETVWQGEVEVFSVTGHPTTTIIYAWPRTSDDGRVQHMTVQHVPPVDSPLRAVQASIVAEVKAAKKHAN